MNDKRIKILLVEDDPDIFDYLKKILEGDGYSVLSLPGRKRITNYYDAITLCERETPDIAILDIVIASGKDGIDLAQAILKRFRTYIIFLSSFNIPKIFKRIKKLNMDDFIIKIPADPDYIQLRTKLELLKPRLQKADNYFSLNIREITPGKPKSEFLVRETLWDCVIKIETQNFDRNYCRFYLDSGEVFKCKMTLSKFNTLTPSNFVRISNDKILNTNFITARGNPDSKNKKNWIYFSGQERHIVKYSYRNDATYAALNNKTA